MNLPLCFVIMPFNKKKDVDGNEINFDKVYELLIRPAIVAAQMEPIRADEESVNGIIHKPMYERLILCDYAVADLSTANANVFYELGIRHAVKPYTTITIFASNLRLPFDVNFLRCMPYDYTKEHELPNLQKSIEGLTRQLKNAKKEKTTDSPVYQLVEGIQFQNSVAHEKTDIFRDTVKYNEETKKALSRARNKSAGKQEKVAAIDEILASLGSLEDVEAGVIIDVMLSYRALGQYEKMISFIRSMPPHIQQTVMVQEQLGFALNRIGTKESRQEAVDILEKLIAKNGPSSETYGILGRVYKDYFDEYRKAGDEFSAESFLDKAHEAYLKGFEADWRDAYPGVNAVTLSELKGQKKDVDRLAPVVEFSVLRKLEKKKPEYWDYATLLELSVIRNDEPAAKEYLKKALACDIEGWMFDTTLKNLELINSYRSKRQEETGVSEKAMNWIRQQQQKFSA